MKYDPKKHNRQSIRKKGHDYAQAGYYFVTILIKNRKCLFGTVKNNKVELSELGKVADECWKAIPEHFPQVELLEYVIMPNHIHGIIHIRAVGAVRAIGAVRAKDLSPIPEDSPIRQDSPIQKNPPIQKDPQQDQPLQNTTAFKSPSKTLGSIIRGFKVGVSKWASKNGYEHFSWHRNYYDRIVNSQEDLERVILYIKNNPSNWKGK